MVNQPVLIVDDEVEMRIAMSETLKHCGYPVEISHNAIDALKKFKQNEYSLVITDMTMPKRSGLELLKDIKSISPAKPVIMATAYGTVETAVEAMKHGAFDYIRKPINFDSFQFIVQQALNYKGTSGNVAPVAESRASKSKPINLTKEIITQNKAMLSLLKVARNVAKSKSTMMIQSESGTGKELLALRFGDEVALTLALRNHGEGHTAHFIGRLASPPDASGRAEGVLRVSRGVVVDEACLEHGPGRKLDGLREVIAILPIEVPVGDIQEHHLFASQIGRAQG